MIEQIDDTVFEPVVLVVTFSDRVERWGPVPRGFTDEVISGMATNPPDGFVSAVVAPTEARYSPDQPRYPAGSAEGGQWSATGTGGPAVPGPEMDATAYSTAGPNTALWSKYGDKQLTDLEGNPTDEWGFSQEARGKVKDMVARDVGDLIDGEMDRAAIEATPLGNQIMQNYGWDDESSGYTVANSMHNLWANTSGDSTSEALALQDAVAREFGLEGVDAAATSYGFTTINPGDQWASSESLLRAYARAEYGNTQAMLQAAGVSEITLYRGIGQSINEGGADWDGTRTLGIQSNPLSSWSSSPFVATSFALDKSGPAYVMSIKVPAARVFSTAVSGSGCLPEYEAILLGGPGDEATVWRLVR